MSIVPGGDQYAQAQARRANPFARRASTQALSEDTTERPNVGAEIGKDIGQRVGKSVATDLAKQGVQSAIAPSAPTFDRGASEAAFQSQRAGERDLAPFTSLSSMPSMSGIGVPMTGMGGFGPGTTFSTIEPGSGLGVLNPNFIDPGTTFSMPAGGALSSGALSSGASGASEAAQGATGAATGGLNVGSLGGGLASVAGPLLGLIGQATGNVDLSKAGSALGAALSAYGTGSALASAAPAAVAAANAAGAGVGGASAAGSAAAGGGAALGAALAPIAMPLLVASIINLAGGGMDVSDMWTGGKKDPWYEFGPSLVNNEQKQGNALNYLMKALPYVQSDAQLQELVQAYRNGATGGPGELSPFLQSDNPYEIKAIPGAGGSKHELGLVQDWNPVTEQANAIINALHGMLPATGGEGAPLYSTIETNEMRNKARATGLNQDMLANLSPADREAVLAQFPEAMDMGPQSAYWQQLLQMGSQPQQQAPVMQAPAQTGAMNVGSVNPGPGDTGAGGAAVGGAGKLSPNFATPEIDRVQQISGAGKLQGPGGQQQQQAGQPFGMRGQRPGGVFGMGGMRVGGGQQGNAPFGQAAPQATRNSSRGAV